MTDIAPVDDPEVMATLEQCRRSARIDDTPVQMIEALSQAQKNRMLFALAKDDGLGFIEAVVEAGADINCADADGNTVLHQVDFDNGPRTIDILADLGAKAVANQLGRTPLHNNAADEANATVLLRRFPEIVDMKDANGIPAIFDASDDSFHVFVEAGADLTVLHQDGHSLLWFAPPGWAGTLILAGADIKSAANRRILIQDFCYSDMLALIRAGADVNATWDHDQPILYEFMQHHDYDSKSRLLLRNGALVTIKNQNGNTSLHMAAIATQSWCARLIPDLCAAAVKQGADLDEFLNARTNAGNTALHLASNVGTARALITAGADVNARDADGNTPLHLAALGARLEMARLLLENYAYTDIRNNAGATPLELSQIPYPEHPEEQMTALLRERVNPSINGKAAAKKK